MPRLKDETKRERRDQISEAAFRCFARNGFAGTSMADIIAESGLSAGSIYSHFDSKTDLLQHVIAQTLARSGGLVPRRLASPVDAISALASAVDLTPESAHILLQLWAEGTRDDDARALISGNILRIHEWLAQCLAEWATERGLSSQQAADIALALMQGLVLRLALDPTADHAKLVATIGETLR